MIFRKKSIDEWAFDYYLLQHYAILIFRMFYRKICVINRHNIPEAQPLILAPNHQNALMDAMVLVCESGHQVVFLARADIFKGELLSRFLTFINIMPIFRIRDGYENVKKNDVVFEKTFKVLQNRYNPLGMFPEGNHGDRRRLRPLVKGIFRIAFMGQEEFGDKPGVKIVPIGIDYGHYSNFRTTLFVNIGKPIELSDFYSIYRGNPVQAINLLKEKYAFELSKLMIDIQTEEYYELYMNLRTIYNDEMRKSLGIEGDSLPEKFKADKIMIDLLNCELESDPENIRGLNKLVMEYQHLLKRTGLRDWVVKKEKYPVHRLLIPLLLKIVLLPVFFFGFIHNYPIYWFAESRTRKLKDPQFRSSFKFVIGMVGLPLLYMIFLIILIFMPFNGWIKAIYMLLLPFTGLFSFEYLIRLKKLFSCIRYNTYLAKSTQEITDIRNMRKNILHQMNDLVANQTARHENAR